MREERSGGTIVAALRRMRPHRVELGDLLRSVSLHSGLREDAAGEAITATCRALAAVLPTFDVRALEERLPIAIVAGMRANRDDAPLSGFGDENAQVVLRALGERLDHELRARLEKHLSPAIARHLAAEEPSAPPSNRVRASRPSSHSTLAEGRPGSLHPVSEARPERAHVASIARDPSPHSETKLSSARGLTQERFQETLAEGAPPRPKRTLADS